MSLRFTAVARPSRATAVLPYLLAVGLAVYAVDAAVGSNALALPGESSVQIEAIAPESWAFFTRSPRSTELTAYLYSEERLDSDQPTVWSQAGGLNRLRTVRSVERALIASTVRADAWEECDDELVVCVARQDPSTVRSDATSPALCGAVVLVRESAVPWAFAKGRAELRRPNRDVALLEVDC